MKPTNELRFVERQEAVPIPGHPTTKKLVIRRILQQKWEAPPPDGFSEDWIIEWRDVPIVKETK